jgi:argininosuccinate lyase
MEGVISTLKIRKERCAEAVGRSYAVALDLAEALAREKGIPFREAHMMVGRLVQKAFESGKKLSEISPQEFEKETKIKVSEEFIKKYTNPEASLQARKSRGSPNPAEMRRMLAERGQALEKAAGLLSSREERVVKSLSNLLAKAGIKPKRGASTKQ